MNRNLGLTERAIPAAQLFPPDLAAPVSRLTLNRAIDDHSLDFVIASRLLPGPVADFGCGEGVVARAALARGAHVYAFEEDEAALRRLVAQVPSVQLSRLRARLGSLTNLDLKGVRFDAIHCARLFHEFDGVQLERILRRFFRWLYPDGSLFLSVLSPTGEYWEKFKKEFNRRKARGDRLPGYILDASKYSALPTEPASTLLLDPDTLRAELEAVGFEVEKLRCLPMPWLDQLEVCAVVARARR